jgi:RNA polymerase sigma factor (TIGR02999 family)
MTPPASTATGRSLTQLLQAWKAGDALAFERVVHAVQADFLRMAASRLHGHDEHTLAKGDMVNEAWLRLMRSQQSWDNRAHFFANAALTIRSVLTDHARARIADKRGGERVRLTLTESLHGEESMAADLLTLDALLRQLAAKDARSAQVVELTYFTGLQRGEIAEVLGISVPTVDRELRFARAWLATHMDRELEA